MNIDNNKIEVGEYVRSKIGVIGIVINIQEDLIEYKNNNRDYIDYQSQLFDIVKHSKNIMDLIEVGDYVNGKKVTMVYGYDEDGNDKDELGICEVDDDYAYYTFLEDIDIQSIVTHEKFDGIKYRVER